MKNLNYNFSYQLHDATRGGNIEVVKLLLKNKVLVRPRSFGNIESPISLAANYDYADIVKLLNTHVSKVKTSRNAWYHGQLNRKEAEQILRNYSDKKYEKYEMNNKNHQEKIEV